MGKFRIHSHFREYPVGARIHDGFGWSPRSSLSEVFLVGKNGSARYSSRKCPRKRKFRWYRGRDFALRLFLGAFFIGNQKYTQKENL